MAGMELVDGVYYTPADLKAKREREAAAEARRAAEAEELAKRVAEKADDEVLAAAVEAAVAPLRDEISELKAALAARESDENAPEGTPVSVEGDSAASGAGSADSEGGAAKAVTTKTAKGAKK